MVEESEVVKVGGVGMASGARWLDDRLFDSLASRRCTSDGRAWAELFHVLKRRWQTHHR